MRLVFHQHILVARSSASCARACALSEPLVEPFGPSLPHGDGTRALGLGCWSLAVEVIPAKMNVSETPRRGTRERDPLGLGDEVKLVAVSLNLGLKSRDEIKILWILFLGQRAIPATQRAEGSASRHLAAELNSEQLTASARAP